MSLGLPFLGQSWSFEIPAFASLAALPSGWVDPKDEKYLTAGGQFAGGPGSVRFATYTDSPSGPYYELIYVPGIWNYSDGSSGIRGTRLFISSEQVAETGATSFHLPKHLARFNIIEDDEITKLSVSLPNGGTPFFDVTVKHSPMTPVEYEVNLTHIQPPMPGGTSEEKCALAETTRRGKKREFEYELGLKDGLGDGVNFPAVKPVTNKGISLQPVSVVVTEMKYIDCID
ncbi:hypothetical protein AMATHDRAFT_86139 [Amanita thiersii Skay4041]|uniref:Uncharacterized protein n=1 Tax=Amanita thiersii Skay4041 TaxID=703135 RepID=A0A2A9NIL0_9AGAR|nr:hypothetical protein AMATHDRAFT_86139 [Amanita thiersii Skay4041]